MRKAGGYSLLEVMVTLGLAGIVSAMALPNFSSIRNEYVLRSAADQLAFEIGKARMQAVAQNRFVRVRFVNAREYVVERSVDGGAYVQIGERTRLPGDVEVRAGASTAVSFDKAGLGVTSRRVTLANQEGQKTVSVNVLGRATVS